MAASMQRRDAMLWRTTGLELGRWVMAGVDEGESGSAELSQAPPTLRQLESDEADLQASLEGMARLVTGRLTLEDLLTRVARFAVHAIPGADGAGVTLLGHGVPDTIVSSAPFVRDVDAVQYGLGEGPCISAAAQRRIIRSGSLGGEALWPRFGPRVGRLGVHSVLSLPLVLPDAVVGAINVYARRKDAFGEHAQQLGELFAEPAAVAVHNAHVLARAQRVVGQLQEALTSRAVIDQAIGIIISRSGGTADEAFVALRSISQRERRKLADVAQKLVDEAARRARARHSES
jgi:transcriptional regulator with GAF, ATPase, and Fis domain